MYNIYHIKGQLLIIFSNLKYVMLQCNNILNDCWTFLKPFLYICILHCKGLGHLWYFLSWVNILPCQIVVGSKSLWAKCLWIEFALGKVLVGKVPGFVSIVWGYHVWKYCNEQALERLLLLVKCTEVKPVVCAKTHHIINALKST